MEGAPAGSTALRVAFRSHQHRNPAPDAHDLRPFKPKVAGWTGIDCAALACRVALLGAVQRRIEESRYD